MGDVVDVGDDAETTTGEKIASILTCVAALFYEPLVIVHGWTWHVEPLGFPALPAHSYWHVMGTIVLIGALRSPRLAFTLVTESRSAILRIGLQVMALSHLIMWLAL